MLAVGGRQLKGWVGLAPVEFLRAHWPLKSGDVSRQILAEAWDVQSLCLHSPFFVCGKRRLSAVAKSVLWVSVEQ